MATATLRTGTSELAQIRILDLPGAAQTAGELALPIQQSEVGFPDQDRPDMGLLKEAQQNRLLSEAFEASRGLIGSWNLTELMLRAYVEPMKWKGSDQYRSHLGLPILGEHFYSMLAVIQENLFGGYNPFMLDPTSGTDVDTAAAETALIRAQLKKCGFRQTPFKQEMRHVAYDGCLYGTGAAYFGWEKYRFEVKKMRNKHQGSTLPVAGGTVTVGHDIDDVEEYVDHVIEYNQAKFEHVPIRRLRVDPACRRGEVNTAGWAGRIIYMDSYQLDSYRDVEGFNIPSREELIKLTTPQKMDTTSVNVLDTQGANTGNPIFQQTTTPQKAYPENYDFTKSDPLAKSWEVFDYWTPTRHVMILEGLYTIFSESHNQNKLPFLSFVFREAPDSFYGYGMGFWLTDYQRIAQGIVNAFFDDVNLNLMGTYTSPAGMNNTAQAQWIFPGKVFKADPNGKVEAMTRNAVMEGPPLAIIEQVKAWAVQISGAGINAQGTNPGKTGDMRTPEGVQAIMGGENVKSTDLIDQICDNVMVPFLEFIIEQNHRLKPSQIKAWLSDELAASFNKVDPLSVLNGQYKVTVSAASRLRARQQLNNVMGFIQTLLQSPGTVEMLGVQALKFDAAEFLKALIDSSGLPYRENFIKPMDADDKQRYAASQQQPPPIAQKVALETQSKKQISDNDAENRMIVETGKAALKSNAADQAHGHTVQEDALNRADRALYQKSDEAFTGGQ